MNSLLKDDKTIKSCKHCPTKLIGTTKDVCFDCEKYRRDKGDE